MTDRMTYAVPTTERDNITKALNRLQKKAERYGKVLNVEVGEAYATKRGIFENREGTLVQIDEELVEVFDVTIDSELIVNDGYEIIARIEHLENGNFVNAFGNVANPEWYTCRAKCDHCGGKHGQKVTFIVRKGDDVKQVGSTCLLDYCGINPQVVGMVNELRALVLEASQFDTEHEHRPVCRVHEIADMLALASRIVKKNGYVKSDFPHSNKNAMIQQFRAFEPTDDELDAAHAMIDTLVADEDVNDSFLINVRMLCKNGYCKTEHFGVIAYAPVAYAKYLERKAEDEARANKKAAEAAASDYIGNVGERITIKTDDFTLITSFETMYGYTYLYKFTDGNGNVCVWFSSNSIDGDVSEIKGTIKEHSEHDGVKQTVFTRCKVIA